MKKGAEVQRLSKTKDLTLSDPDWIASCPAGQSGHPYSCEGLTRSLSSRFAGSGCYFAPLLKAKLSPLRKKTAPHYRARLRDPVRIFLKPNLSGPNLFKNY